MLWIFVWLVCLSVALFSEDDGMRKMAWIMVVGLALGGFILNS